MKTSLTWLGHASFQVNTAGKSILIDALGGDDTITVSGGDIKNACIGAQIHGFGQVFSDDLECCANFSIVA